MLVFRLRCQMCYNVSAPGISSPLDQLRIFSSSE